MALIVEALALKERDVPEYIEVDFKKMIAKFKRGSRAFRCPLSSDNGTKSCC